MDCNGCIHKKICALWGNAEGQNAFCYDENCKETLKDIIGADYDLDRLRELMEADRDGRCVVLPCSGWMETVFGDQETFYGIDHDYLENPVREISVDSSDRCTWYDGWKTVVIKGYDENGCDWEFSPEEIGKTVFRTREAAEAALKGEAYGG